MNISDLRTKRFQRYQRVSFCSFIKEIELLFKNITSRKIFLYTKKKKKHEQFL